MDSGHDTVYGGNLQGATPDANNNVAPTQSTPGMQYAPNLAPATSSGVGDVVLPVVKKKNRLPLIIAIVAVLLVIGVVVLVLTLNRNAPTVANLQTAYNRYANYLIYGEDSTKNLEGEYNRYGIYALHDALNNEDTAYFDKLEKYLNDYMNMASKINIENILLIQANAGIASSANFVIPYGKKGVLDSQDLLKLVVEKDSFEDVEKAIEDFYIVYAEQEASASQSYFDLIVAANSGEAEILYAYKTAGCIENGEVVFENCEMTTNYSAQSVENDRNAYWAQTFINSSIGDILRYTWQARDGLGEWSNS